MPQARHGGNSVRSPVVAASKLEGRGFEKLQIGQTHVALLAGVGSCGGRWKGLSRRRDGDAVALLEGGVSPAMFLFWIEDRFEGFGTRVIFGEDLRKPA